MASLVLGIGGGLLFGPLGFLVGSAIGALIDPPKQEGPRLQDLKLQGSSYGNCIPLAYGTIRLAGNVIWQTDLVEHKHQSGGKGGPKVTTYTYTASFATQLCDMPFAAVLRIWADKQLIWDRDNSNTGPIPCKVYLGTETQLPDPTIEAAEGVGNVPGFRGTGYVVFTDWELTNYGNRIPSLEFEITTSVGPIPWRVSTFDPYHGQSDNGTQWGTRGGATLSGDILTTFGNIGVVLGGTWMEWTQDIMGSDVVNTVNQPFESLGTVTVPWGACINGPQYSVYLSGGSGESHWYLSGSNIGVIAVGDEFGVDSSVVKNGFIYTVGDAGLCAFALSASGAPSLVPSYTASIPSGGPLSLYRWGDSDNEFLYLRYGTGFSSAYFKYDAQLNLVDSISAGTTPHEFAGGQFLVYQNQLVFNGTNGVFYSLYVYTINDDGTYTFVGSSPQTQGGITYLGAGLVIGHDGVLSLNPQVVPITLADIVSDVSVRSGLLTSQIDVTQLTQEVRGYLIASQMSGRNMITPLQDGFFFDPVVSDNKVKYANRGSQPIIDIPDNDLAAVTTNSTPPALLETERTKEEDLPQIIFTRYLNIETDYQTGTQQSQRLVTSSQLATTLDLPIVFNNKEAKHVSDVQLMQAWVQREKFTFYTSREYEAYEPTDVVIAGGRTMMLTDKEYSPNLTLKFEGVASIYQVYQQGAVASDAAGFRPPTPPAAPQITTLTLLDLPLVTDNDSTNGFYAALVPSVDQASWPGASLYKSLDSGATYTLELVDQDGDTVGACQGILGDFFGGNIVDELNSLTVVVSPGSGELSSTTNDGLLNNANMAWIGTPTTGTGVTTGEIIQYRDAVLTADSTYTLTGLLRGRRDTESFMGSHIAGETFVALPSANPVGVYTELGSQLTYKAITLNETDGTAVTFTNYGNALTRYSPVHLGGGRNVALDVIINWIRRTRIGGAWLSYVDVPLSQPSEIYAVTIYSNSSYNVTKRLTTTVTPTFVYTAAMQTTDFGSTQSTVYGDVYQVGAYQPGIRTRFII